MFGVLMLFYACSSNDEPEAPKEKLEPTFHRGDSLALVNIYKAADGDNWRNGKWDLNDFMTWSGVSAYLDTVHNEYRVCELYIRATSEAHGTLSPSLGDLTELRSLIFTDAANIKGQIPPAYRQVHLEAAPRPNIIPLKNRGINDFHRGYPRDFLLK